MENIEYKSLDILIKILTLIYISGGGISIILSFIFNYNREHIGLAFLCGSLLSSIHLNYRYMRKINDEKDTARFFKSTFIIWLSSIIILILIYKTSNILYAIPIEFFLLIGCNIFIIGIQILFPKTISRKQSLIIISEILSTSILISLAFLFLFPSAYGNDAPFHIEMIQAINNDGYIPSYAGQYMSTPLFHILSATIDMFCAIDLKTIQVALLIEQIAFLIFIFLIMKKLFNHKIALISLLIAAFSNQLILPRYMYYPSSFAVIFFIMILFLLFINPTDKSKWKWRVLLVIIFIASVLSHPFAPVIILFTALIIYISMHLLKIKTLKISPIMLAFMSFFLFFWWSISVVEKYDIFTKFIISLRSAFSSFDITGVERATLSPSLPWVDILLYDLGLTILLWISVLGSFIILKEIRSSGQKISQSLFIQERISVIALIALVFMPIPYLLGISAPNILPDRWFAFIEVLCAITGAVSLYAISVYRYHFNMKILVSFIMAILIFFMITSPVVNPNSQIYSINLSNRNALTQSEITACEFLNTHHPEIVRANSKYIFLFKTGIIDPENESTYSSGLLVIRKFDLENGFTIPLFGAGGKLLRVTYANYEFITFLNMRDKIYDIGEVRAYYVS